MSSNSYAGRFPDVSYSLHKKTPKFFIGRGLAFFCLITLSDLKTQIDIISCKVDR